MTDYLNVGKIVNTQGLKGEVRVISVTDFAERRYQVGQELFLFQENKPTKVLKIRSFRQHKNFDIISFEDHPSINDIEAYRDGILKVAMDNLGDLEENEFYYHEIIGLPVFETNGNELGKVKEILSPGANDVWVVQRQGQKDVLLPYIESVVLKVDVPGARIEVEIPEGLIDDEN